MKFRPHVVLIASICGLLLAPGITSYSLAQIAESDRSRPTAVTTQITTENLRSLAESITVKVYAGEARGSGILTAKDGQTYTVVTNAHVVDRGEPYRIQTVDGKIHIAKLLNKGDSYAGNDLAWLEFQATQDYAIASLGDSTALAQNEMVFAAGFPFDGEQFTFNNGNISLIVDKPLVGGYQIGFTNDTPQGMSGGALLNAQGKVIGILGQISSPIIDDSYTYQDGSSPNEQLVKQMRDSSFAVPIATALQMKQAIAPDETITEIDKIAQQITVRIDSIKSGNGSGAIIAREGNTYSVLTAAHVVKNPDRYTIVTPDGQKYPLNAANTTILEGVDLAVVRFSSEKDYAVATLADYYIRFEDKPLVFVSGFPGVKSGTPTRKLTAGSVAPPEASFLAAQNIYSLGNGYQLVYSNISGRGMSGGPVLDRFGRVIGINAAAEAEWEINDAGETLEIQLGRSLGVPVSTFLGLAEKAQLNSQLLQVATDAPPSISETEINATAQRLLTEKAPSETASAFDWLNWGNQLWRVGKNKEAAIAFERAVQLKPDFYQAYYAMGRALDKQKKYPEALAAYDKAIQINPSIYESWREKASIHQSLKQYDRALTAYDKAIQLNPDDATLYLWRGLMLYGIERYQEAKVSFDRTIALNPSAIAYIYRGDSHNKLREYEAALADYNQGIALQPHNFLYYNSRALLYAQLGNSQVALADANKIVELASETYKPLAYQVRGFVFVLMEDFKSAIADATKIIEAQADERTTVDGYSLRALAYANAGESQKAIADYTKIIELQPNNADVYHNRANRRAYIQDYQAAMTDYTKALELDPNRADSYSSRAALRGIMGDAEGSRADYQKAIALLSEKILQDPNKIEFYLGRALARSSIGEAEGVIEDVNKIKQLSRQQGSVIGSLLEEVDKFPALAYSQRAFNSLQSQNYQSAIADYTKAIELNPNVASSYLWRGIARSSLQDYQGAMADLNKAIELDPQNAYAYNRRATVRTILKDYQNAIADYNKSIALNPQDAFTYYSRGLLYNQVKDYQSAIADFSKTIEMQPDFAEAYAYRGITRAWLNDYQSAITDVNRAIELQPNAVSNYFFRGVVYHKKGDRDAALSDYQTALNKDENFIPAINNIGLIEYETGNVDRAIELWQKAIKINEQVPELQLALAVAFYTKGERDRGLEMAKAAIALDNNLSNLDYLKELLWHERLLTDARKLLENLNN
jgi:tetratricopeptide (TPR) repeat protein